MSALGRVDQKVVALRTHDDHRGLAILRDRLDPPLSGSDRGARPSAAENGSAGRCLEFGAMGQAREICRTRDRNSSAVAHSMTAIARLGKPAGAGRITE